MIIYENSGFVFGPPVRAWEPPNPNDTIFGLLGSQALRKQPHLGSGVPTHPPLAPTTSGPKTAKIALKSGSQAPPILSHFAVIL